MAKKKTPPPPKYEDLKPEYARLWAELALQLNKYRDATATAKKVIANRGRYEYIATKVGCPWFVCGVVHAMEGGCDFTTHMHNGDPLTARTRNEPKGCPKTGKAPFTWEESAVDAFTMKGWQKIKEWPVERICFELERYNGWGYRWYHKETLTPYLWSGTHHYADHDSPAGKYVSDGSWSSRAVSGQSGAMAILKRMTELDPSIKIGAPESLPVVEENMGPIKTVKKAAARTKDLVAVGWLSTRVRAAVVGVASLWAAIVGGFQWLLEQAMWLVDQLPAMTGDTATLIGSQQQLLTWLDIPWATVGVCMTTVTFLYIVYRTATKEAKP